MTVAKHFQEDRLSSVDENIFHMYTSPEGREFRREWKMKKARHKQWALQKRANFQLQQKILTQRERRAKESKEIAAQREKNALLAQYHTARLGLSGHKVKLTPTTGLAKKQKRWGREDQPPHDPFQSYKDDVIDAEFHDISQDPSPHPFDQYHQSRAQRHQRLLAQFHH